MADQPTSPVPESQPTPAQPGSTITPAGAPRPVESRTTTLDIPATAELPAPLKPTPPAPEPVVTNPAPHTTPATPPAPAEPTVSNMPVAAPAPQPTPNHLQAPFAPQDHTGQQEPEITPAQTQPDGSIVWTASEFIAHEKTSSWYGAVMAAGALLAGIIYLLFRDIISSVVVIVCAAALSFYGSRKPKQQEYVVAENGIGIGARFMPYEDFRSFAVMQDGAFSNIIFFPLKRFATLTTMYYAPEDEERIIDVLADRLPFEEHTPDPIDRLMRRIRF